MARRAGVSIPVRRVGGAVLPGVRGLVVGYGVQRWPGTGVHVLTHQEGALRAHALDRAFGGDPAPLAVFPDPDPEWARGVHATAPDGSFAVFSGRTAVRAVNASGRTLWEHGHDCWGCDTMESGSCHVTADGRYVWATVPGPHADGTYAGDEWLVLDASDGEVLAGTVLGCAAAGSNHLPHPDGVHMGLGVGEGQDGTPLYWGRRDGRELTTWPVGDEDRVLADVHPSGAAFLTVAHSSDDLAWHRFPDGAVGGTMPAEEAQGDVDPEYGAYWDYSCGYVDEHTVLASATAYAEEDVDTAPHWLLDALTLRVLGEIAYPVPVRDAACPLGDGTWLTEGEDGEITRWTTL